LFKGAQSGSNNEAVTSQVSAIRLNAQDRDNFLVVSEDGYMAQTKQVQDKALVIR